MALLPGTLATELDARAQNTTSEQDARDAWASAWTAWFYGALAGGVPVAPGSLAGAQLAMSAGMVGLSVSGAAAIQSGLVAFWATVVAGGPTIFPSSVLVTPPPGLGAVSSVLAPVFAANVATSADRGVAFLAIAGALYGSAGLGGTATLPGPVIVPIV